MQELDYEGEKSKQQFTPLVKHKAAQILKSLRCNYPQQATLQSLNNTTDSWSWAHNFVT